MLSLAFPGLKVLPGLVLVLPAIAMNTLRPVQLPGELRALLPVEVGVDVGDGRHLGLLLIHYGVQSPPRPPRQSDLLPLQDPLLVVHGPPGLPVVLLQRHYRRGIQRICYRCRPRLKTWLLVDGNMICLVQKISSSDPVIELCPILIGTQVHTQVDYEMDHLKGFFDAPFTLVKPEASTLAEMTSICPGGEGAEGTKGTEGTEGTVSSPSDITAH